MKASLDSTIFNVIIVTPVYNDFAAFATLARDLGSASQPARIRLSIVAVDDGSLQTADVPAALPTGIDSLEIRRLVCNLGHQRAIAVGLASVASLARHHAVVVMDCDGEDRPADLLRLLAAHRCDPSAAVVASRARRTEGLRFRLFYAIYKGIFAAATGRRIDFGNFMVIPASIAVRLAHMPETWNHLAAAVLRSSVRIVRVPCDRGTRYAGRSSMNLVSLLTHGLSAISVFSDLVFVRLLALASIVSVGALVAAAGAIAIRTATDLAIPGWASSVVGISAIMLFQALTLSVVATLTMLGTRSAASFVPALHARSDPPLGSLDGAAIARLRPAVRLPVRQDRPRRLAKSPDRHAACRAKAAAQPGRKPADGVIQRRVDGAPAGRKICHRNAVTARRCVIRDPAQSDKITVSVYGAVGWFIASRSRASMVMATAKLMCSVPEANHVWSGSTPP